MSKRIVTPFANNLTYNVFDVWRRFFRAIQREFVRLMAFKIENIFLRRLALCFFFIWWPAAGIARIFISILAIAAGIFCFIIMAIVFGCEYSLSFLADQWTEKSDVKPNE